MDNKTDWLAKNTKKIKEDLKERDEAKKLKGKPKKKAEPAPSEGQPISTKEALKKWDKNLVSGSAFKGKKANKVINPKLPEEIPDIKIFSHDTEVASTHWMRYFYAEFCKPLPSVTPREEQLGALVQKCIEDEPFETEGKIWARKPRAWFAQQLGISERQVQRIVAEGPFKGQTKIVDDKKVYCLRVAPKYDLSDEDAARIMANEWKKHTKDAENESVKVVSRQKFGQLKGLAVKWGSYYAPDVFVTILNNWSGFNACCSIHIELGKAYGDSFNSNKYTFKKRFYKYPSIAVMLRFHEAGWEVFEHLMHMQHFGKSSELKIRPDALNKLKLLKKYA